MSEGTFREALTYNFLKSSSFLREEPMNILRQEFPNPSIYSSILSAMGDGKTQISHISDASGVEMPTCSKYISNMESAGIVRREMPVSNSKKRHVYGIADGLFSFRYSVIDKVRMQILAGDEEGAYESAVRLMPGFMGGRFETICRQFLFLNTKYRIIGKWWGNDPETKTDAEIDIVAADGTGTAADVLFGSCRYSSEPMGIRDMEELIRVSALVKGYRNRDYALFSLSGFDGNLIEEAGERNVKLYTLKDLYRRQ
jgi:AAA+ ATPase superfamily predicted ATPase